MSVYNMYLVWNLAIKIQIIVLTFYDLLSTLHKGNIGYNIMQMICKPFLINLYYSI